MKKWIPLFAAVFAYAALCLQTKQLVSAYTIVNAETVTAWTFGYFGLACLVLMFVHDALVVHGVMRRAETLKRHKPLNEHVANGVQAGNFAYLMEKVPYGDRELMPMNIVYVAHTYERGDSVSMARCVPYFGDDSEDYKERPSLPFEIELNRLYQHVPITMIPKII